jgi:hypothetical protein
LQIKSAHIGDAFTQDGAQNDWSVCTTWMIVDKTFYLIDVVTLAVKTKADCLPRVLPHRLSGRCWASVVTACAVATERSRDVEKQIQPSPSAAPVALLSLQSPRGSWRRGPLRDQAGGGPRLAQATPRRNDHRDHEGDRLATALRARLLDERGGAFTSKLGQRIVNRV